MTMPDIDANIEVTGSALASIMDGFGAFKWIAIKYLQMYGLAAPSQDKALEVDTSRWYPLRACLKVFEAIMAEIGPNVIFDIGLSIPKNARFPPVMEDIDSAIRAIDIAYHMNHRKGGVFMFDPTTGQMLGGIGHYGYQRVPGERRILSICDNPYPCQIDHGIITTMARRFEPRALITHDHNKPCRARGGQHCTYIITW